MDALAFIVLNDFEDIRGVDQGSRIAINRQAFQELEKWAIECQGQPRRWYQYAAWPSRISLAFLDVLAMGDDVALLVFIHWAAIMSRDHKDFLKAWAVRAGMWAVHRVKGNWSEQLAWPLELLAPPGTSETGTQQGVPVHLQLPSHPGLDSIPTPCSTDVADVQMFPAAQNEVTYPCTSRPSST